MKCPFCQAENTRVLDTRKYDTCVLRIRLCGACLKSFPTSEETCIETITVKIYDTKYFPPTK